jgi:hypothetical protein
MRLVLLQEGRGLPRPRGGHVWLSLGHDTVRKGVLQRRRRVREPVDVDLQRCRGSLPQRRSGMRERMLCCGSDLRQRRLHHTGDMQPRVHGWHRVLERPVLSLRMCGVPGRQCLLLHRADVLWVDLLRNRQLLWEQRLLRERHGLLERPVLSSRMCGLPGRQRLLLQRVDVLGQQLRVTAQGIRTTLPVTRRSMRSSIT